MSEKPSLPESQRAAKKFENENASTLKLEKMTNYFGFSVTSQKVQADLEVKNQEMMKRMEEMAR